jgi:hypothetical protein
MLRWLFALALGMHGVGHALFVANSWGYWKTTSGRAGLFASVLHLGQSIEGTIGLLWMVPLVGFAAATLGLVAQDPRWPALALGSAVLSSVMLLVWWGSLNASSAVFALLFNIVVIIAIFWQRQPLLLGR